MNSKISEKDKKIWNDFLSSDQKLPDKDNFDTKIKFKKTRLLDLHGKNLGKNFYQMIKNYQTKIIFNQK